MVSGIPPRGEDSRIQPEDIGSQKVGSNQEDSDSLDEVEDLDNRISECTEEIFESQEGTPRTEEYASEYDLHGRVEQELPTGFFRNLLRRIFSIARRVWGVIRRCCYCSNKSSASSESFRGVDFGVRRDESYNSRESSSSQDSLAQQYNKRLKAGFVRVVLSPLQFKIPAHSKESVIAAAKLMLMALRRVDDVRSLFLGIPLEKSIKQTLIRELSPESSTKWREIQELCGHVAVESISEGTSNVPAMRALLKLCMVPTFSIRYEASNMMTSLSDFDPLRSYETEKLLAQLLQDFSALGEDEKLLVQDLLFGLREKFIKELESLVSKLYESNPNLNRDIIDQTVGANAATIAKAYYHNDVAFDKQLNAIVKRFFRGWKKLDFSSFSE
ncbi:hypothetical protein [Chlamydiifrater volucris]|uniref:TmeB family type III secretion system effector n=1 Tax=Chlamydiifrater volucris TaxID=2681470 RepID=UPI001BD06355|nr:hypothetical protein [Chlamydiifrater volucris]